jgi:predicted TIM-barrel fold metal-dependent hydrolase
MAHPYFERTPLDARCYETHLRPRLPAGIFDVHVHLNLPEHLREVPAERWRSDWALESGHLLPVEDAYACARELFPDARYAIAGMPWPIREADLEANNRYLADKRAEGVVAPFMAVRPEWVPEEVEQALLAGGFVGFKPYADMVSGVKGADLSIFDFLPPRQLEILDRHGRAVLLHLPRRERIADPDNVRELREILERYPRVTVIVAHLGRSFCPYYLREGLRQLGRDAEGLYFDTSAVINPATYELAFDRLDPERILFGTDMPILFWHGRRTWTEREYRNLCREPFSWNTQREPPEVEATYTLFLYEQMRSLLDAVDRHRLTPVQKEGVFWSNARRALKLG